MNSYKITKHMLNESIPTTPNSATSDDFMSFEFIFDKSHLQTSSSSSLSPDISIETPISTPNISSSQSTSSSQSASDEIISAKELKLLINHKNHMKQLATNMINESTSITPKSEASDDFMSFDLTYEKSQPQSSFSQTQTLSHSTSTSNSQSASYNNETSQQQELREKIEESRRMHAIDAEPTVYYGGDADDDDDTVSIFTDEGSYYSGNRNVFKITILCDTGKKFNLTVGDDYDIYTLKQKVERLTNGKYSACHSKIYRGARDGMHIQLSDYATLKFHKIRAGETLNISSDPIKWCVYDVSDFLEGLGYDIFGEQKWMEQMIDGAALLLNIRPGHFRQDFSSDELNEEDISFIMKEINILQESSIGYKNNKIKKMKCEKERNEQLKISNNILRYELDSKSNQIEELEDEMEKLKQRLMDFEMNEEKSFVPIIFDENNEMNDVHVEDNNNLQLFLPKRNQQNNKQKVRRRSRSFVMNHVNQCDLTFGAGGSVSSESSGVLDYADILEI